MVESKKYIFTEFLKQQNYKESSSGWNEYMNIGDGFTSDDFWPILRDGKMYVHKKTFLEIMSARLQKYPYRNKNLDTVINDFKTLSRRNFYMMPFVEETDTFYVFEYGAGVPLSPENIERALPQLKNYFQFNNNVENDLKLEYMGELFYDEFRNKIKLVDLSSLWYVPHINDENAVHKKYWDPGILFSQKDDNTVTIYSFIPDSMETRQKIQKYIDIAQSENHTCTIKYV